MKNRDIVFLLFIAFLGVCLQHWLVIKDETYGFTVAQSFLLYAGYFGESLVSFVIGLLCAKGATKKGRLYSFLAGLVIVLIVQALSIVSHFAVKPN